MRGGSPGCFRALALRSLGKRLIPGRSVATGLLAEEEPDTDAVLPERGLVGVIVVHDPYKELAGRKPLGGFLKVGNVGDFACHSKLLCTFYSISGPFLLGRTPCQLRMRRTANRDVQNVHSPRRDVQNVHGMHGQVESRVPTRLKGPLSASHASLQYLIFHAERGRSGAVLAGPPATLDQTEHVRPSLFPRQIETHAAVLKADGLPAQFVGAEETSHVKAKKHLF